MGDVRGTCPKVNVRGYRVYVVGRLMSGGMCIYIMTNKVSDMRRSLHLPAPDYIYHIIFYSVKLISLPIYYNHHFCVKSRE